jgi:hypothetical protein
MKTFLGIIGFVVLTTVLIVGLRHAIEMLDRVFSKWFGNDTNR